MLKTISSLPARLARWWTALLFRNGQNVLIALVQIWANKGRSILTTLGIIIAVTSIITVVSNNYTMAIETSRMRYSQEAYRTRDLGGNYADLARTLGGRAERVEDPEEIGPALQRARRITEEEGLPVLVEVMTSSETERSTAAGW